MHYSGEIQGPKINTTHDLRLQQIKGGVDNMDQV